MLSPIRSGGSILKVHDKVIGSELIGQKFTSEKYFWGRPSAADYNPISSSASQRSGTDAVLKKAYEDRLKKMGENAPADLLFASGSGLDPHISVEAANFQKHRINQVRGIAEKDLNQMIATATEERFLGFMGQPRVNVLKLNLLLDKK
jgi:K+-transporting ATPase ATPase C chain